MNSLKTVRRPARTAVVEVQDVVRCYIEAEKDSRIALKAAFNARYMYSQLVAQKILSPFPSAVSHRARMNQA